MNDSFSFYLDDFFVELMPLAALSTCISWCSLHPKKKKKNLYLQNKVYIHYYF